ncbi:hypothetical protein GCM10011404_20110 [Sphingomonas prati]|nr:hypothetical protein GCM10011404_20110 [Sphingomonas prati]
MRWWVGRGGEQYADAARDTYADPDPNPDSAAGDAARSDRADPDSTGQRKRRVPTVGRRGAGECGDRL